MVKSGIGAIIYTLSEQKTPVLLENGKYILRFIDGSTGESEIINKAIKGGKTFILKPLSGRQGAYWFEKI